MKPSLVKLSCDIHLSPQRVIVRAGERVTVCKQFDNATYNGQPMLLVRLDSVTYYAPDGFFVRGWEYTTDLAADVTLLQAGRIENALQNGLALWSRESARTQSPESDSGGGWTLHGDPREFPRYTVSWIDATGELYAWQRSLDQYLVLAQTAAGDEARAEFLLEGWADYKSAIHNHLTALREQIAARQDEPTPAQFSERFKADQHLHLSV